MSARIEVTGSNDLADSLRDGLRRLGHVMVDSGEVDAMVAVHDSPTPGLAIEDYTDEMFGDCWELPIRSTVERFNAGRTRGARRFVVVTSSAGMSGSLVDAPVAMAAEALRAMVKSVARQWGPEGRTVNAVAVDPELMGAEPSTISIAPRALGGPGTAQWDIAPLVAFCCSDDSHHLTGSTLMADGGSWMP